MNINQRLRLAIELLFGRASLTFDWGEIKAEGFPVGDDAALVLLTHDEASRLEVK